LTTMRPSTMISTPGSTTITLPLRRSTCAGRDRITPAAPASRIWRSPQLVELVIFGRHNPPIGGSDRYALESPVNPAGVGDRTRLPAAGRKTDPTPRRSWSGKLWRRGP
jgi:hypothetical protein